MRRLRVARLADPGRLRVARLADPRRLRVARLADPRRLRVARLADPGLIALGVLFFALAPLACGGDDSMSDEVDAGVDGAKLADGAALGDAASAADGHVAAIAGGVPSGWLYTKGNQIYVSSGVVSGTQSGTPWMGRGVNMDDLFMCGHDNTLQIESQTPSAEDLMKTMVGSMMKDWKPTFVRVSLGMASYTTQSWLTDSTYKTAMTSIIDTIGVNPNVYVLVTLRTEASMIEQDPGNPEATNVPSDTTNTPNATAYPTGTDEVYAALVDTFQNSNFVIFGMSNEPGGNVDEYGTPEAATAHDALVAAAMNHAVGAVRAEEDKLGVPHHLVSVQGTKFTSKIDFYSTTPLSYDNVVYEVHGYPPTTDMYTFGNIPVILGEYGTLSDSAAFYTDVEAKQIPNLAWDFDPFSGCQPDLLNVNDDPANLSPSPWGDTVKAYLNMYAK